MIVELVLLQRCLGSWKLPLGDTVPILSLLMLLFLLFLILVELREQADFLACDVEERR
jgi:hypothetical protein